MLLWLLLDSVTCFLSPSLLSGLLFSIRSLKVYNDVFYCKGAHKLKFSNTANCCWGSRSVATMSRALPGIMSPPTASASPGSSFSVSFSLFPLTCLRTYLLTYILTYLHRLKLCLRLLLLPPLVHLSRSQHTWIYKYKPNSFDIFVFRNECRQIVCNSPSHGLCECGMYQT